MKIKPNSTQVYIWLIIVFIQFIPLAAQSFDKKEFANRRKQLMQKMDAGIAIFSLLKSPIIISRLSI